MANAKQSAARRPKMAERAQQQLEIHFPGMAPAWMWSRKTNDGYTTLPRTLPLAMQAVDDLSKGTPAGHTLFCLWARAPDNPLVIIEHPATFAAEAGFTGERAVDTWRKRMRVLRENCMIMSKPGPSGEFHYVLLLNPNAAVELLRSQGKVRDVLYSRFIDRLAEVGAYSDAEAIRAFYAAQAAAAEAAKAAAGKEANATASA